MGLSRGKKLRQEDVARWDEERGVMCMMKHNGLGWRRKHHDVRKRNAVDAQTG